MQRCLTKIVLSLILTPIGAFAYISPANAQVTAAPDGTNTQINHRGDQYNIQGGTLSRDGQNLFHSFEQFGLTAGEIATFLSNPHIQNILGRVTGGDASVINGLLQITGGNSNLYLINPAGILFGANARLDLPASFTATTATGIGFGNTWFSAIGSNDYANLVGNPDQFAFTTAQPGSLVNAADLAVATGESLMLLGGTVINTGTLSAPEGAVTIAAVSGENRVRVRQEGLLLSLELETTATGSTPNALPFTPLSLPELLTGGNVEEPTGLTVNPDGTVQLTNTNTTISTSAGTAIASGIVDVSGDVGGSVAILGDRVGVLASQIIASGTNSGGTIRIGGDYQGQGSVFNASRTVVSQDSSIQANALTNGNGGRVIVWADDTTRFVGTISAQGGTLSGNGGFVEVSGAQNLLFDGLVNVTAINGQLGTLLLDPTNITISTAPDTAGVGAALPDIFATDLPGDITINATTLENQAANVVLEATDNISIINGLSLNFGLGGSITFTADTNNDGVGAFSMDPTQSIVARGDATTNGRNITISGTQVTVGNIDTGINSVGSLTNSGNIQISSSNGTITTGSLVTAINNGLGNAGSITLNAIGGGITNASSNTFAANGSGGAVSFTTTTGNIITGNIQTLSNTVTTGSQGGSITLRVTGTGNISTNTLQSYGFNNGPGGAITLTTANGNILSNSLESYSRTGVDGNVVLEAGGTNTNIVVNGVINARDSVSVPGIDQVGTGNITLTSDEINLLGGANSVRSLGQIQLQPFTPTTAIALNGAADSGVGTFDLLATDLATLGNGFSSITIGRANGSGTITLGGDVTFNDPVTFRAPAGSINTTGGTITGTDNATIALQALADITTGNISNPGRAISITSTEGIVNTTAGTISTGYVPATPNLGVITGTGGNITILGDSLNLGAVDALIYTGGSPNAGNIFLEAATGGINASSLTTSALSYFGNVGNAGNITVRAPLGDVNITGGVTAEATSVGAGDRVGNAGTIDISTTTGTVTLGGAVSTSAIANGGSSRAGNSGNILITAPTINLNNNLSSRSASLGGTAGANGTNTLTGTTINTNGTISGNSNLIQTASGTLTLGGTVTFNDPAVFQSLLGSIDATGSLITTAGNATLTFQAGQDIALGSIAANTGLGGITAQANNNIFAGEVSLSTNGGDIILNSDRDSNGAGAIALNGVQINSNGGDIVLGGGTNPRTQAAVGNVNGVRGVDLNSSTLNAGGGDISIRGSGTGNTGITLASDTLVETNGDGTIELNGTGNGSGLFIDGILLFVNSQIRTVNGDITLNGLSSATGDNNDGIEINASSVEATGTGSIQLTGIATANGVGVGATTIRSNTGDIQITGTGNGASTTPGISLGTVESTGGGDVTLTTDEIGLGGGTLRGGILTLRPLTVSQAIALGGDDSGSVTTLDLTNSDLAQLQSGFNQINIGRSTGTGTVTLNSGVTFSNPINILGGSTLVGLNQDTTWIMSGADQGNLNSTFPNGFTFNNIENITTGDANDTFVFEDGGSLSGDIAGAGGNLTLTGNTIDFGGTVSGTGDLVIQPTTAARNIQIGGAESREDALILSRAEVNSLQNGFSSITIGRENGRGDITVNTVGFRDPTTIQAPDGSITVNGGITGVDDAAIALIGATTLNADISTEGQDITLRSRTTLEDNVGIFSSGGNILFASAVNSVSDETNNLTVNAGNGTVRFGRTVGSDLGNLNVTAQTTELTENVGAVGNIRFNSPVTIAESNTEGLTLSANNLIFEQTFTAGSTPLTLIGSEIDLLGGADTVSGQFLTLQPSSEDQAIEVGDLGALSDEAALNLTSTDINALADGFRRITIGSETGTGNIAIGDVTFRDPVIFRAANGTVSLDGNLTLEDNARASFRGGTATILRRDFTTNNPIDFGRVELQGNVTLRTTATDASGDNAVTFGGPINGNFGFRVNAPNGTVRFDGRVGEVARLAGLEIDALATEIAANINTDGNIVFNSPVTIGSNARIDAGQGGITANNTITGRANTPIDFSAGRDIVVNNITAPAGITLSSDGSVRRGNPPPGSVSPTGILDTRSEAATGGTIRLFARGGIVEIGDLLSSGATGGGEIVVRARDRITTGAIDSSATRNGNGGLVELDPIGDVEVRSINTQGSGNGNGGDVRVVAGRFFRALSTFDGVNSISTRGGTNGGTGGRIFIRVAGQDGSEQRDIPFVVGNASINGTAGAITTGSSTLTPPQRIEGDFTQGNIQISTEAIEDPTIDPPPPPPPPTEPPIEPPNIGVAQTTLQQIQSQTSTVPALIYVGFVSADIPINNDFAGREANSTQQFAQYLDRPSGETALSATASDTDELEILIVTSKGEPIRYPVPGVTRAQVRQASTQLLNQITDRSRLRSTAYLRPAQQLYQWLIAPIEAELQAQNIENLSFIMDAGLRSLPIAALHDGNQFLIEKYSVGFMPSLNLTDTRYSDLRDAQVLAMGASDFQNKLPDLPAVPTELLTITNNAQSGRSFLNNAFTLENLQLQRQETPYRIVHLATHAEFREGNLSNSYIQFWNQQLQLDQLRQLNLNNPPVDLLVLSACRTALGDEQAELGFGGLAVQAGVRTALASLWYVSDDGTLGFMTEFYQQLRQAPIKAEALRRTQLAMLQGKVQLQRNQLVVSDGTAIDLPPQLISNTERNLTHPYYWAAFTMIGSPW
ncbi:MAG: CHAT domain-containing protein [Oculatellaceae cyanobacterium bins.114]|nr:CHAT domain-containing protein [Oculatellaceae cyanobacterium bins.114]